MMNMEEGTLDMMSEDESALELGLSANDTTDTDEVCVLSLCKGA